MKKVTEAKLTFAKKVGSDIEIELSLAGEGFHEFYTLESIKDDNERFTRIMEAAGRAIQQSESST